VDVVNAKLAISRISVPKASDVLAGQLRETILDGRLVEGAALPTERELAERSGLSRASVREALRILEVEGLIATRPGRNGGSAVRRPSRESVERSLSLFIRGQKIRFRSLLETREAIEPSSARLAALRRDEEELAALEASHARVAASYDDIPAFLQANIDWHLDVVRASHNELLIAFMTAISRSVHAATDLENFNSDDIRMAVIHAHRRILDAIRQQDTDAAERRMRRHVCAYVDHVQQRAPREIAFNGNA
jgi:GntR family transcriptional repressor for pyruvate dehydrogenase complex